MKKNTIGIVGGNGFIGQNLVNYFVNNLLKACELFYEENFTEFETWLSFSYTLINRISEIPIRPKHKPRQYSSAKGVCNRSYIG